KNRARKEGLIRRTWWRATRLSRKVARPHALPRSPRRTLPPAHRGLPLEGGGAGSCRAETLRARPGLDGVRRRPRHHLPRRPDVVLPPRHSRFRALDGALLPPRGGA